MCVENNRRNEPCTLSSAWVCRPRQGLCRLNVRFNFTINQGYYCYEPANFLCQMCQHPKGEPLKVVLAVQYYTLDVVFITSMLVILRDVKCIVLLNILSPPMCMKALLFPAIISHHRLFHQVVIVFLYKYMLFYECIAAPSFRCFNTSCFHN